jgi:rubrerythrin
MDTQKNLEEAFAGESQANRKYLAFAQKAEDEGYPQAARLFRAAASAETVHALAHFRAMEGVKSTRENLDAAINGETFEFTKMYPQMIEQAKKEEHEVAEESFDYANQVESIHAGLYKKVLDNLGNNPDVKYYVCQYCGNTVENEAPESCPICGSPRSEFKLIQ